MTPVVYVHGLWMPGDESLVLRHRLSQEFALSLHSFRYSAAFASIQSTTERLAAFVSDLKTPAVHFVGHSLGGLIIHRFLEGFASLLGAWYSSVRQPVAVALPSRQVVSRRWRI